MLTMNELALLQTFIDAHNHVNNNPEHLKNAIEYYINHLIKR